MSPERQSILIQQAVQLAIRVKHLEEEIAQLRVENRKLAAQNEQLRAENFDINEALAVITQMS